MLAFISCLFIHSTTEAFPQYGQTFVIKQIIFYILGFSLMVGVAMLDVEQLKQISWFVYAGVVLLLIGLIFAPESIARPINEAKAWYQIKFLGSLQPSEFLKFAFVLVVTRVMEKHYTLTEEPSFMSDCRLLCKVAIITMPPMLLVYQQPDTGMILLYLALLAPMIFFSSINKKLLITVAAIPVTLVIGILIIYFQFHHIYQEELLGRLSPHQVSRINGWLQPFEYEASSYQTRQGILAIGTGEIIGKGYRGNDVYIPEKHTDFIFSTIAEETGFIGGSIVILLYFLLLYRLVVIVIKARTRFAYITGAGIISLLTFQIFQNIGMTMGLLPVTGVTLPFLSYGGSSLLSNFLLLGVILSFRKTYENYFFLSRDENYE
ncbi:FtsW/RodA/SpoVE family cell cycle protein [Lysinibacillus odysseyi]|uniref:FtsW/RodA/SpoVE family cell cycle protein n=1 Tax=Lysinibacillus odysseyi TaxID=202611 RepID=UPI000AF48C7B|nr:FtsW/RodA/SpoVE family cell cycle protein [Lysinibacillus odysseyi]